MSPLPDELCLLLDASNDVERERAWRRFVEKYSRLLLHVARSIHASHDDAMDAYAHMLEQLAFGEYRSLRRYAEDRRSKFTTWLVVVARRLCLDHYRKRYGRHREGEHDDAQRARTFRRRLQSFASEDAETDSIPDRSEEGAEEWVRRDELHAVLEAAVASLEQSDKLLLQLRFEQDLSAQEIANALGFPSPFHVYRRLNAITASLRALLVARGVESAAP